MVLGDLCLLLYFPEFNLKIYMKILDFYSKKQKKTLFITYKENDENNSVLFSSL